MWPETRVEAEKLASRPAPKLPVFSCFELTKVCLVLVDCGANDKVGHCFKVNISAT
jgi:hypothetical protein